LFPKSGIRSQLLFEVVDFVLVFICDQYLFEFVKKSKFSYNILKLYNFVPCFQLVFLKIFKLLKEFGVCGTELTNCVVFINDHILNCNINIINICMALFVFIIYLLLFSFPLQIFELMSHFFHLSINTILILSHQCLYLGRNTLLVCQEVLLNLSQMHSSLIKLFIVTKLDFLSQCLLHQEYVIFK
jgi:hypothetical protein